MKSPTKVALAIALAIAAGGVAQAQDRRDNRNDNRYNSQQRNDYRHDQRDSRNNRHDRRNDARGHDNRHDGDWRRGGRVPAEYRHRQYVVHDWRGHRLHRPPSGHQWVQHGNDYALAAIATGIITELLVNHHH
jgi:Ni/Co efflux regulator RcnB